MAEYRLFFLGSDGAVEARYEFAAPNDDVALQIMAVIGKASADAHHGFMLWQGARRIFEVDGVIRPGDGAGQHDGMNGNSLERLTATRLAAETQQCVLECEEALLDSHWRLAKSQALLQATTELRRAVRTPPAS